MGTKRQGGETTSGAKRLGGKRLGGKRLGGETTRGRNGLGAKRPGFVFLHLLQVHRAAVLCTFSTLAV